MGALWEMKAIQHQEEVLVDNHHLTAKDLKLQEGGGLMDHLEMMDCQMMEDILQDEDHQEEDPLGHQEEVHLAPWPTWKSWAPRK